jgi:hypothetical protein
VNPDRADPDITELLGGVGQVDPQHPAPWRPPGRRCGRLWPTRCSSPPRRTQGRENAKQNSRSRLPGGTGRAGRSRANSAVEPVTLDRDRDAGRRSHEHDRGSVPHIKRSQTTLFPDFTDPVTCRDADRRLGGCRRARTGPGPVRARWYFAAGQAARSHARRKMRPGPPRSPLGRPRGDGGGVSGDAGECPRLVSISARPGAVPAVPAE